MRICSAGTLRTTQPAPASPAPGAAPHAHTHRGASAADDGDQPHLPHIGQSSSISQAMASVAAAAAAAAAAGPRELHIRLFDLIPQRHTGRPTYYVIHAWQGACVPCLRAVIARILAQNGGPQNASPALMSGTFVWVDWVAVQQQAWLLPPGASPHASPSTAFSSAGALQYWGPMPGHVSP